MNIRTVCVIGMGTMGSEIGIVCANSGFDTIMVEVNAQQIEKGLKAINSVLQRLAKKKLINENDTPKILDRIKPTTEREEAFSKADLIIEATFEDMNLKKELFKAIDEVCKNTAIIASNTSTLSITEIAAVTSRPDRSIGMHFLIPATLNPVVELVKGIKTSEETHRFASEFIKACKKSSVTSKDSPAFIINRLYVPLINEAFLMLQENLATAEEIDFACQKGLGFPLGPFAASDSSGLDVVLDCVNTLHKRLGDKYRPSQLLVNLVNAGNLGRKTGRGVFKYAKK